MTGERTQQALSRIEAALARIEAALPRTEAALATQVQRNDRLRRAIGDTIRDLDRLIADGDPT